MSRESSVFRNLPDALRDENERKCWDEFIDSKDPWVF
jgi:hypothetical protein